MARKRILIVVKTYPTLSEKYMELACTAGICEDGSLIRLYPIPFRLLNADRQFKKYQWIEADVEKNDADTRPESYKIINTDDIVLLKSVSTENFWSERKRLILETNTIYTELKKIIEAAHSNLLSLVIFKPKIVEDFIVEKDDSDWNEAKINKILELQKQIHLFPIDQDLAEFKVVRKLPYKFKFKFKDSLDKTSTLMIEDWEIGQLYWNCVKKYGEQKGIQKVREKYFDDFAMKKDLYFFLGTTFKWHKLRARNPFVIIGTFHPPNVSQLQLF